VVVILCSDSGFIESLSKCARWCATVVWKDQWCSMVATRPPWPSLTLIVLAACWPTTCTRGEVLHGGHVRAHTLKKDPVEHSTAVVKSTPADHATSTPGRGGDGGELSLWPMPASSKLLSPDCVAVTQDSFEYKTTSKSAILAVSVTGCSLRCLVQKTCQSPLTSLVVVVVVVVCVCVCVCVFSRQLVSAPLTAPENLSVHHSLLQESVAQRSVGRTRLPAS
jgi:hypothetical protein